MTSRNSWLFSGLGSHSRRLLAAGLAAIIGTAFLTASIVMLSSVNAGFADAVAGEYTRSDLVIEKTSELDPAATEALTPAELDALAGLDGVRDVVGETTLGLTWRDEYVSAVPLPRKELSLATGRLPVDPGEIAINPTFAEAGIAVGDTLTLAPYRENPTPVNLTVVGVVEPPAMSSFRYGFGLVTTDATLRTLDPALGYSALLIRLADGTDATTASGQITSVLSSAQVRTGAERAREAVSQLTGQTDVIGAVLIGFAGVALLTTAIVIANTFTITVAQRTSELALLRAVGATRPQVRRMVVFEALVLGLVASVLGVLTGLGLAAALLALGRRSALDIPLPATITVPTSAVVVPLVVGLLVTVLAALLPAARATRVSPLAAMRPSEVGTRRRPWVRVVIGLGLAGLGGMLMGYAGLTRDIYAGLLGGVVSFGGVLLILAVAVPAVAGTLGLLLRRLGVPGKLAVDNALRNPGRAAATTAALLVGVTLITMTTIGAATGERTALGAIDGRYAVDFVATAPDTDGGDFAAERPPVSGSFEPSVDDTVAAIPGVDASDVASTAYLFLGEQEWPTLAAGIDGSVLHSAEQAAALVPGTVGMSGSTRALHGLDAGSTLTVTGPGGSRELTVVDVGLGDLMALTPDDLAALGGESTGRGVVLVRLQDRADLGSVLDSLKAAAGSEARIEGQAMERAMISRMLDTMVLVAAGLLAVAVLIALIGIANTLSLSVIERRHEHSLLRGLGLTRLQLRSTLLLEGVLLAAVACVIGVGLGVVYAYLGVMTVLPERSSVRLAVPLERLGLIVAVALIAGLLASVLPARRAAKVSPVEGLAAV